MNLPQWLQFIETAIKEGETIYGGVKEFEANEPVSIQFDPWDVPAIGFHLDFSAGSANFSFGDGQLKSVPLSNWKVTLPEFGPANISAGDNAVIVQKAS